MRQFDNPMTQQAYELFMKMSVEQLAVVIIRLRDYMGDFDTFAPPHTLEDYIEDGDC